ncbi:MAG: DNA-directed RNA polymerase subunit omega [Thermodesulfobacteriota bacterium]|nr:DNA-directed RNA polymerase subunit omega [Thermodesulfobacteriota bacterium]
MARITVEDSMKKVPSRFELVHLTAQRVRQIREGAEYLVNSPKNEDIVVALREIAAGKITQENMDELSEMELFSNIGAAGGEDADTDEIVENEEDSTADKTVPEDAESEDTDENADEPEDSDEDA